MDLKTAQRQLHDMSQVGQVIAAPLTFKAQLGIGSDAYTSIWLGRRLQTLWDVGGVAATGAGIAKSGTVATTFFAGSGWLSAIGLGGAAATPIFWVVAAAVTSAGAYYGITRLLKDYGADRVTEVPHYINTPLDVLAISLFDLMAALGLKIAAADGQVTREEEDEIRAHFVEDWGYSNEYVTAAMAILSENAHENRLDDAARAFVNFAEDNPDCNAALMRKKLIGWLTDIAHADGHLDEREEMAIDRIERTFTATTGTGVAKLTSKPRRGLNAVGRSIAKLGPLLKGGAGKVARIGSRKRSR
ncbi:MAG: TerB family tellurite resistance protein [Loktanella sp.]|nr:TerB family tellurite resistance protein [Loktanella sp.]